MNPKDTPMDYKTTVLEDMVALNQSLKLELQKLQNDLDDALSFKNGKGPTAVYIASLRSELQKQKELSAELVKAAEEAMKCLRAFKEVSGLPTDDVESQNAYHKLKSLIKKSNEI